MFFLLTFGVVVFERVQISRNSNTSRDFCFVLVLGLELVKEVRSFLHVVLMKSANGVDARQVLALLKFEHDDRDQCSDDEKQRKNDENKKRNSTCV